MNARRTAALILAAAALMALNAGAYAENAPDIAAGGAALIEQHTGAVICAKEAHKKLPMASTTKIMTALIVIENCSLGDTVKVSPKAYGVEGSSMYLNAGEEVSVEDMLYGLMLLSGNDAAVALAEYVAGTRATFVEMMNQRVKQMGCTSTSFTDVHGVGSGAQYTTARDMIRIMMAATDNARLNELLATQSYEVPATNLSEARKFKSQNYLMETTIVPKYNYNKVTAGFASYSDTAGASVVCTRGQYQGLQGQPESYGIEPGLCGHGCRPSVRCRQKLGRSELRQL